MTWTAQNIQDQAGRTFLVTGANSGLGYVTALELARHHANVIMVVRNPEKGRTALAAIAGQVPGASLQLNIADLTDLDTVRQLAEELKQTRIDVLVNNAGVMMPPRVLSKQGHESQFAGNHLGHFALTGLLLPQITDRVVTVSSDLHRRGHIHFDDLTGAKKYSPLAFYAQSKFANVLFGLELARRLRSAGSGVRSLITHPGYAATNLQTTGPTGIFKLLGPLSNKLFAQPVEKGVLSQLYAATDPSVQSGQYFGPGRGGHPKIEQPIATATSLETARRLWELSEDFTGVTYTFGAAIAREP
ncbi:oxidoreductase [Catelliglobosispora koreensis]|uniref:oxidoreductase n=1 Tax=Catelliglobosispora koreensis TaxID=129052 RepID=UPI00035C1CD4|nr:oxidoreductase [Catelliglobosispora koreensis]